MESEEETGSYDSYNASWEDCESVPSQDPHERNHESVQGRVNDYTFVAHGA
jgi:hypothetical protein